jgi:hypothetical protein
MAWDKDMHGKPLRIGMPVVLPGYINEMFPGDPLGRVSFWVDGAPSGNAPIDFLVAADHVQIDTTRPEPPPVEPGQVAQQPSRRQ